MLDIYLIDFLNECIGPSFFKSNNIAFFIRQCMVLYTLIYAQIYNVYVWLYVECTYMYEHILLLINLYSMQIYAMFIKYMYNVFRK